MSEEAEVADQETVDISKQVKKVVMVEFLTSSGKINEEFARSLYDAGLNSWKDLIEGDEEYFVAFKGIGPAKAKLFIELGKEKKLELETTKPGLKEVLETVPRINQNIISALLENGYDSFESFREKTEEDLVPIKGIGPKMSVAILNAVKEHVEKYGAEEPEEATAEVVDEEAEGPKDERSFIQRIIDFIKGIFGGNKDVEKTEEEKAPETEEAPVEEKTEEESSEVDEEAPVEEEKVEEPVEEPAEEPVEEPVEEKSEDEPTEPSEDAPQEEVEEEKEETPDEEPEASTEQEESPEEEKSFLDKIKSMFSGGPKTEEEKVEEPTVEGTVEEAEGEEIKEEEPTEDTPEEPVEEKVEETSEDTIKDFEDIPGVSKKVAQQLKSAGYLDINELKDAVPEDLTMIEGIGPKTAEKICKAISK